MQSVVERILFQIRSTPNSWFDMDQYNRTKNERAVGAVQVRDRRSITALPAQSICGKNGNEDS